MAFKQLELPFSSYQQVWDRKEGSNIYIVTGGKEKELLNPKVCERGVLSLLQCSSHRSVQLVFGDLIKVH